MHLKQIPALNINLYINQVVPFKQQTFRTSIHDIQKHNSLFIDFL